MRLSLLEECRDRAKQALGALGTEGTRNAREEMRLHAALGASTPEAAEMGAAFTKVLDIAESLGDSEYQLRALRGLYFYHTGSGRFRTAPPFAQRLHDLAMSRADLNDRLFGEHYMGVAKHYVGDQTSARRHFERVLNQYAATDHGRDIIRFRDVIRFQTDLQVSARMFLARVLWWQGLADQAVRAAEMSIEEAQATGHALSLCYTLALAACPIALWVETSPPQRATQPCCSIFRENTAFRSGLHLAPSFKELSSSSVAMSTEDRGNSSPVLTRSSSPTFAFDS